MPLRYLSLLLLLLGLSTFAQAQTRKIAHRSHGGQPATFAMLMDEDHAGNVRIPIQLPLEKYNLKPWVAQIKKHYENVAKQTSAPAEAKTNDTQTADPKANDSQPSDSPSAPKGHEPELKDQKTVRQPAKPQKLAAESPASSTEMSAAVPRFALAKARPENTSSSNGNLWLLAGLLLLTVGPGVVVLSGTFQRKRH